MKSYDNKILFKEIKSYEEAYFYNSAPEERNNIAIKDSSDNKKKDKIKRFLECGAGELIEGAIEVLFSIID